MTHSSLIPNTDLSNLQHGLESLQNIMNISLTSDAFDHEEILEIVKNYEQLEQLVISLRIKTMA